LISLTLFNVTIFASPESEIQAVASISF